MTYESDELVACRLWHDGAKTHAADPATGDGRDPESFVSLCGLGDLPRVGTGELRFVHLNLIESPRTCQRCLKLAGFPTRPPVRRRKPDADVPEGLQGLLSFRPPSDRRRK